MWFDLFVLRRGINLLGATAGLTLWLAGCSYPAKIPAQNEPSPVAKDAMTDHGFYGFCSSEGKGGGGHSGPWVGPLRKTKTQADADVHLHETAFPGHIPTVVQY